MEQEIIHHVRRAVCGYADAFVGAYVIASVARGDFVVGRSDVDVLVVFADDVPAATAGRVAQMIAADVVAQCDGDTPVPDTDFLPTSLAFLSRIQKDLG